MSIIVPPQDLSVGNVIEVVQLMSGGAKHTPEKEVLATSRRREVPAAHS